MFQELEKAGLQAADLLAASTCFCSSKVYKLPLLSHMKLVFTGAGLSGSERFGQFDIYFPIAIGFQILALPGFVRLADIFSYAQSKGE